MSQVLGQRTTNQADTETRIVRQVYDEIGLLEPNVAPLVTLLMRLKKRTGIKSPRWEWFEDDYVARWGATDTSAYLIGDTSIGVVDGTVFAVGDLVSIPRLTTDTTAPEVFRVTAVSSNTLTVVRNVGGAGAAAIAASTPLRIVGNAFEEGANVPTAKTTDPTKKTTYLQIFRTAVEFTKTAIATQVYGAANGDRAREHKKKLAEHKQLLNAALLFGRASESMNGGPNSKPIRTTQGLLSAIQTNVTDCGGTLTRKLFESFSRQAFRYGPNTKLLLAAPIVKSAINEWAREFLLVKPSETKYGVRVQQVETAHGQWLLVNDWMLENGPTNANYGFGSMAFSVDLDQLRYMFLNNNGINRDTAIHEDIIQDGSDRVVDEILTEGGYAIMQEKWHARLANVSDYV